MITYEIQNKKDHVNCQMMINETEVVCTCEISVNKSEKLWNITSWFTKNEFKNRGFGKDTMKKSMGYCMETYGSPEYIQYTWNGSNSYVLDWIESHFDAICTCPIAVQKTQADDDWSSHIYDLNKDKVLEYFGL